MDNLNIVLIGFMGSGKSSVAKNLSIQLKKKVISIDEEIIKKEKVSINDIFKEKGEKYFRKIEKYCVKKYSEKSNQIIDCGGGVFIDEENIKNLKKNGKVFFLETSPKVIYERIKKCKDRPLLQVENPEEKIKDLLNSRIAFYKKADYSINTDNKNIDEICLEIISCFKQ